MTKWVGFPNTNGTPSDPVGTWAEYVNQSDRTYCRAPWTATEAGTLTHVNVRWTYGTLNEGPHTFIVAYNGTSLIGWLEVTGDPTAGVWSGYYALTEVSAGSLDFAVNDVLRFGIAFDGPGSGTGAMGLSTDNSAGGTGNQFSSAAISTAPLATVTWSVSGTSFGLAAIAQYEEEAITLAADSGAFTITGTDAGLEKNSVIAAEAGSVAITGADATLTYSAGSPTLSAEAGAMAITGADANLEKHGVLSAEAGAVTITGADAGLSKYSAVTLSSTHECGNGVAAATFESPAGTFNIVTECDPSPADDAWGDWFYFKLAGVNGMTPAITVDFDNDRAGGPYWNTHGSMRPVWSYDGVTWNRLSSASYNTTTHVLSFTLPEMTGSDVYVAADVPALFSDLQADISTWEASPYCTVETLSYGGISTSQGGRSMYYLRIADDASAFTNKFELIIVARAHPGEPQAGHAMKGAIDWILSADADAVALRARSILHIFPCSNPDGVVAGRLRSFNDGTDGNRGFDVAGPSSTTEPDETFLIHSKIAAIQANVSYAIDLHSNNYASPRMVYDATNDTWSAGDLAAIVAGLNALDDPTPDYFYDDVYNMVLDYNTGWRGGLRDAYGIDVMGIEGGMYAADSGTYPTAAQREAGGAIFLEAFVSTFEAAVYLLSAEAGAVAITGTDSGLEKHSLVAAEAGAVALSGQDAGLLRGLSLSAESAAMAVAGQEAALVRTFLLAAEAGSMALTGADADLNYNSLGPTLTAETGAFALTGADAQLLRSASLSAESGAMEITGSDAALRRGLALSAEAGAISISGAEAGLLRAARIAADQGAYTVAGAAATLFWSGELTPEGLVSITVSSHKPAITATAARPSITVA
jgi:hypothetical protein